MKKLKQLKIKLQLRWRRFKFAIRHARKEFDYAYVDLPTLAAKHLTAQNIRAHEVFSQEREFIKNWKINTEALIAAEREKMLREGYDYDEYIASGRMFVDVKINDRNSMHDETGNRLSTYYFNEKIERKQ